MNYDNFWEDTRFYLLHNILQELEVLGFSSLRRYKVWPKEAGVNTAASSSNVTIGADSEFPPPPVWPIN